MAIGNFSVGTIDLTSVDEKTGLNNTANVYFVPGLGRELSIAELVIAICLDRAAGIESDVVSLMTQMSENTKRLEDLTWIENLLAGYADTGMSAKKVDGGPDYALYACEWYSLIGADPSKLPEGCVGYANFSTDGSKIGRWTDWLQKVQDIEPFPVGLQWENYTADAIDKICNAIETKLDALNTTSQETLIKLQSLTNKRDQTYDLITAMTKNTLTAAQSISSNMR